MEAAVSRDEVARVAESPRPHAVVAVVHEDELNLVCVTEEGGGGAGVRNAIFAIQNETWDRY